MSSTEKSDTRRKLEEAAYFLKQVRINKDNLDPFLYNLSAFVSSARSVTMVMCSEYKRKNDEFFDWYQEKLKKHERAD